MSWIKDKINKFVLTQVLSKAVGYLEGKKTAIGAINLLLWVAIYAVPAFTPDYNWITQVATQVRDALASAGVPLDAELFNTGVGFTVLGLADKIRKLITRK